MGPGDSESAYVLHSQTYPPAIDSQTCKVDAPGSLDLCFVTEGSLKPVIARLEAAGIPIVTGPAPRSGALGPMTSIYCEDPDGNLVEVSTYARDAVA